MYDPEVTDINQPVEMPLPDGTTVKMTAYAKHGLTESVVKLRVKKAGDYEYITFMPPSDWLLTPEDAPKHLQPTREINLRDFLAFHTYRLAPSFTGRWFNDDEGGQRFWRGRVTLADGDDQPEFLYQLH